MRIRHIRHIPQHSPFFLTNSHQSLLPDNVFHFIFLTLSLASTFFPRCHPPRFCLNCFRPTPTAVHFHYTRLVFPQCTSCFAFSPHRPSSLAVGWPQARAPWCGPSRTRTLLEAEGRGGVGSAQQLVGCQPAAVVGRRRLNPLPPGSPRKAPLRIRRSGGGTASRWWPGVA